MFYLDSKEVGLLRCPKSHNYLGESSASLGIKSLGKLLLRFVSLHIFKCIN